MPRWFLSYHSSDQAVAEQLKGAIEHKDSASQVFFAPTGMRAGGSWTMQLAQEIIDVLVKPNSGRYVLPYNIARIHATAGDNEKALEWLEMAYDQASADLIELNSEPVFDGLRKELRFVDLMRRVGWSL